MIDSLTFYPNKGGSLRIRINKRVDVVDEDRYVALDIDEITMFIVTEYQAKRLLKALQETIEYLEGDKE